MSNTTKLDDLCSAKNRPNRLTKEALDGYYARPSVDTWITALWHHLQRSTEADIDVNYRPDIHHIELTITTDFHSIDGYFRLSKQQSFPIIDGLSSTIDSYMSHFSDIVAHVKPRLLDYNVD
jgi:hypothetical protein